jgi:hypothetical protein
MHFTVTDSDDPREEDVQRFELWLRRSELFADMQNAIGRFLSEFASFDAFYLTVLLRAISRDPMLVENLVDLMNLDGRLALLERLMKERQAPPDIASEVASVIEEARKLKTKRNEIAHGRALLATASFQAGEPGEHLAGVQRAKAKHPPMPPGGFKSQADMERYMRQTMHTVADIDGFYERMVALNRRASKVGIRLRIAMGLEGPQRDPK